MNSGKTIFSQILEIIHPQQFARCVARHRGDYKVRSLSCYDQFLCLIFGQLTYRESLRDIIACLSAHSGQLYHLGFRSTIARSTLADANERRPWPIYFDLAQSLITRARKLYMDEPLGFELQETLYALDSTTIDLCLNLFPWAKFRSTKAAIKLHTQLDLRGSIPTQVFISDGKMHDIRWLDQLLWETGAIYLFDRGYIDFERLYNLHQAGAYFVTRAKKNFDYCRLFSQPVDRTTGLTCDQIISVSGFYPSQSYPEKLRRVGFYDTSNNHKLVFLTNHFGLEAITVTQLYKARWQIELFFKWIKQHLRIKTFYGISPNAVYTQIWAALCAYLMVAILKKELHLSLPLHTILQIISVHIFQKVPLHQLLAQTNLKPFQTQNSNQLSLNIL